MSWTWVDDFLRDVRHGARSLARTPAFTVVALLTLALGIGANTAIFSIVNGVLLRPLPYPHPEQLMYFTTQFPAQGFLHFWVSPPEYMEYRELNRSLSDVGAYQTGEVNLQAGDRPIRVRAALVDEHLLNALGVRAVQGRLFGPRETDISGPPPAPGQPPILPPAIAVLSSELWQRAFGGQPIVGRTVDVNDRPHLVLGIMEPGADIMDNRTEIWLPIGLNPANRQNRGSHGLYLVGRLKDGVSMDAARGELSSLIDTWAERAGVPATAHVFNHPKIGSDGAFNGGHVLQMAPLSDEVLGSASRSIWILQAAVALVLFIACANLANLLLARAESRHREFAVRAALGATRGRMVRQFVTEGLLLSFGGGAIGVWLARVGLDAMLRAYPASLPRTANVAVDWHALVFAFIVAVLTGVVFGVAPAMNAGVKNLFNTLKDGSRGATGAARLHLRRALVSGEVALAVVLAIGAALLVRTVSNLSAVDAGFDRARLVTFSTALPAVAYPTQTSHAAFYASLLGALRSTPGVESASAMTGLPPTRPVNANDTDIADYTAPPQGPFKNVDYYQWVMSDYFETMGIPIVQGRSFQRADAGSSGMVAVVNQTFVNTFWKGRNPIGERLRPCCGDAIPWFTVIGVAKDVKQGGVDQKTGTEFYMFAEQAPVASPRVSIAPATMNVVLKTSLPPSALSQTIGRVVADADRTVPVVRLRDMEDVFDDAIKRPRLLAQLVGGFGALALVLAAIGVYGVLSYMVAERRREIGIRMALGASRGNVLANVMRRGVSLAAVGTVAGVLAAAALTRLIASLLFGVKPTDAATFTLVIAAVLGVASLACWIPGWRASRVDPNIVLRDA
jgi:predicted permease